jgi:hypothetical protein
MALHTLPIYPLDRANVVMKSSKRSESKDLHLILSLPLLLFFIDTCHPEQAQRVEGPAFAFVFAVALAVAFVSYKYLSS